MLRFGSAGCLFESDYGTSDYDNLSLAVDYDISKLLAGSGRREERCLAYSIEFYQRMFYPSLPCGQCSYCWFTKTSLKTTTTTSPKNRQHS